MVAPGKAWERGTDDLAITETFRADPAGERPARQRPATSRKRVLRGGGATLTTKRRQRARGPARLSLERLTHEGADVVNGAAAASSAERRGTRSLRGLRAGRAPQGFVQEPGRPRRLRGIVPGGQPAIKGPGSRAAGAPPPRERTRTRTAVPPSEGNEARREGRRGVGAPQ